MKNRRLPYVIVLLSFLWSGCAEIIDSPANESPIETPASPSSVVEDLTAPAATTVEATSIPTSTDVNSASTIPVCPKYDVQTSPSADFGIPGTIVYQERYQGLYTVGGHPLVHSKLPVNNEQEYFAFGFSPDGNWFAFSPVEYSSTNEIVFDSPKVILLSANGERIERTMSVESFTDELPVGFRFFGFSGYSYWINNSTIYAALYSSTMTSNSPGSIADLPKVMDPFAGVWREDLLKDLPEETKSFPKGISPDLTRMLYRDIGRVVLKNLENGSDIWHDKELHSGVFGPLMFWSPDSETVAYANMFVSPEERTVVLISRDGIAKPIMGPTLSLSELAVTDVRWSPDGQYLALLTVKDEELSVFIYDVEAEKYISQCPVAKYTDVMPKLIWSPDNRYLAYAGLDYPLVIMDVQSGETIKLAEEARAVGWSDKFPVIWP